jgi:putative heme-binding domain-containing protein
MGTMGQNVGPDLTSLAQRFSTREILESTLDPSKVVADRYSSKIVLTADGKQFNGMAINQSDGAIVVLQSDGKRVRIPAEDIEAVKPSAVSAMPTGLLDGLSESEVADLMAFLMQRANATAKQAGPSVESVVR